MGEGIDDLLHVFGDTFKSREILVGDKLYLALLESNEHFVVRYYGYNTINKQVELEKTERFQESELRFLHMFCAFSSPNGDAMKVQYDDRSYYARPLSLWLAPVAFLLIPNKGETAIEQCFHENDMLFQSILSDTLWRKVHDIFMPSELAGLQEDSFQAVFSAAVSSAIMPRQWSYQGQLRDFSCQLYSETVELEELSVSLDEDFSIHFEVPAAVRNKSEGTSLGWAYSSTRLEQQKEVLVRKVQQLYKRLKRRQHDIDDLMTITKFPTKLKKLRKKSKGLKKDFKRVEKLLDRSEKHVTKLLKATPFAIQSVYQFYPITTKEFKVFFEDTEVRSLGRQICRILHTLFTHQGITFDMHLLYAYTKEQSTRQVPSSGVQTKDDGARQMLKYLNEQLIRPHELEQAKAKGKGELSKYEQRLKKGILLLEKCIKRYPELELASVLQDYQYYYEEYFDEGLVEDSFSNPVYQQAVFVSKKTARERISKQLKSMYKHLEENGYKSFAEYLKGVIRRTEQNGVHYYTFRPAVAGKPKWRAINWQLSPPEE